MDTIAIYCKDCGALFYASSRITPDDVIEIVAYAKDGHRVVNVDPEQVRVKLASCRCVTES